MSDTTESEVAEDVDIEVPKEVVVPAKPRPRILIRNARVADMPQLEDLLVEFYISQIKRGNKLIAKNPIVLRGGTILELGMHFANPDCKIMVADKDSILLGFFMAQMVFCRPIEEFHRAVWIRGDYMTGRSVVNSLILKKMWQEIYKWGVANGGSYFYADIHQSNQASVRSAKGVGFHGNVTRFLKLTEEINKFD